MLDRRYAMQKGDIKILAIETSCDETAAAVICNGKITSNIVASQSIHTNYGGVVPELAARAHQKYILSVIQKALSSAHLSKEDLDAIAFTRGPGLLGALLTGACFAKSMALGLSIPLLGVHHMRAHILANFIEEPYPMFPFLCLTVSGGHTQLVLIKDPISMELVGQTQDDAVGEAYDKIAKMMGFPYPGGPWIDRYAQDGNPLAFSFPITNMPNLDFSFSGIKTAFLYFLSKNMKNNPNFITSHQADLCASIQYTLIQMLLIKVKKAMVQFDLSHVALAGGVAANQGLRLAMNQLAQQEGWQFFVPAPIYCTDNAAMVAMAAYYQYLVQDFMKLDSSVLANLPL